MPNPTGVALTIKNSAGAEVRRFTYSGPGIAWMSQPWNGKNTSGLRVANGTYTFTLSATDIGGSQVTRSETVTVR